MTHTADVHWLVHTKFMLSSSKIANTTIQKNSPIQLKIRFHNNIDQKNSKDDEIAAIPKSILIQCCFNFAADCKSSGVRVWLHNRKDKPWKETITLSNQSCVFLRLFCLVSLFYFQLMVSQLTFGLIGITMFLKKGRSMDNCGGGGALVKLRLPLKSGCKES